MTDTRERAIDAPFVHPSAYREPISGTCTRCGQPAVLGESRWWHLGPVCPARGRTAEFVPD